MNKKKILLGLALSSTLLFSQTVSAQNDKLELSLNDVVQRAFENEPRVEIAKANVSNAKGSLRQAWGANGLNIAYNYTAARGAANSNLQRVIAENYGSTLQASLPLYTGGANEGNIDKATGAFRAQEYSYDAAMQTIKYDATGAYFTVLADRDTVAFYQESVDNYTEHLKNVKMQFEVGTVAKVDVLSSEVALANAQQNLTKAQKAYEVDVANLLNMIGLPVDTKVSFSEHLKYDTYDKQLAECMAYALQNQPAIYAANEKVKAALAGMQVARAGYQPTIALVASNSWQGEKFPGNEIKDNWTLAAKASITVLDSGVTAGKVQAARATYDTAIAEQRQTIQTVNYNVNNAYLGLRESEQRINTAGIAVSQAEESYRIAQLRYQAGVGTNLDALDAALKLTDAKNNYVSALYSYNVSKAALDRVMGISTGMELAHKYDRKKPLPNPQELNSKAYPNAAKLQPAYEKTPVKVDDLVEKAQSVADGDTSVSHNQTIQDFLKK